LNILFMFKTSASGPAVGLPRISLAFERAHP
jgi:hypothetical protein